MPSKYSTETAELCKHPEYRVACPACRAADIGRVLAEAVQQTTKCEHDVQGYKASLDQSDLSKEERARFEKKLAEATQQHFAWSERSQGLKGFAAEAEREVRGICNATEPADLAEAFEGKAIDDEEEFTQIWRNAARTLVQEDFVKFSPASASSDTKFNGLDRSNIPATPDCLVKDGTGFQVFLRHGKALDHRQPRHAIGQDGGPAIMSYGRALSLFGVPEAQIGPVRQKSQAESERTVEESMKKCAIAADELEPKTEHNFRCQQDNKVEADLTDDQQWALFKSGKFMGDAALLARQYTKLVVRKENTLRLKKAKSSGKSAAETPAPTSSTTETPAPIPSTDNGGWPDVEKLDWVGFTNWVHRCKKADKNFGLKVMKQWNAERAERRTAIVKALKDWKPPKDFDDGSSTHPDPKLFWPYETSLGVLDLAKIGRQADTSTKKGGKQPRR